MTWTSAFRAPLIVAAAQPRCTPFDLSANAAAHAEVVRAARARVVVFPELSLTGYQLDAPAVALDDPVLIGLQRVCAATDSVVLLGAPVGVGTAEHIATLRVDSSGADVVHRKVWLSDAEAVRFTSGPAPAVLELDGWRLGLATCKETGVDDYTDALKRLGVDAYLAGVVHRPDELDTQNARGRRISRQLRVPVVLASAAGPAGHQCR